MSNGRAQPSSNIVTAEFSVAGMTCGNCVRHVTQAIQSISGVQAATVTLETRRANVRWSADSEPNDSAIIQAIKKAGYDARRVTPEAPEQNQKKFGGWETTLWIGVLGTVPLMLGEWVFHAGATTWFQWASFAIAAAVQIFAGAPFYRGAWNQLKAGSANMDALVVLGSTTAFAYSAWVLIGGQGGHVFFMEAAAIITLISLGHWMEARVSSQASSALRALLNLAPQMARRIQMAVQKPANQTPSKPLNLLSFKPTASQPTAEIETPVADLIIGDLIALRPGDRVPTDGEVVEGDS